MSNFLDQNILYAITRKNASGSEVAYGTAVKWDAAGFDVCGVGEVPMGFVLKNAMENFVEQAHEISSTHTTGNIESLSYATIVQLGTTTALLDAAGSVTEGSAVMISTATDGKIRNWTSGYPKIGYSAVSSSTAGAEIKIFANCTFGDPTSTAIYQPISTVEELTVNGAISITNGWVQLNKAGVLACTLANPTVAGLRLSIRAMQAQANTITLPSAPGLDGAGAGADVGTFGGTIGDGVTLYSRDVAGTLRWCEEASSNVNVTWA